MASKPSNEVFLQQLKQGIAEFELASSPVTPISSMICPRYPSPFLGGGGHRFFARIGSSLGGISPALKKVEHFSVQKVTGDGRCLFRALVKGMAINKGITLTHREERDDADELRMAVKEVICYDDKERSQYEEALVAITVDESLKRCYQSCASSQSLFTYQSMSIGWEDGALVLFLSQSTELSSVRHQRENQGR
ncbi:PREDICTED: uncharacterized protein LOC104601188 isoform X4 [Nelumbo nucifera]|uniref:Ubiquitin thioesterase OTU n=2 Tax=Nelumbo nucifera TaxID=4432 RepID=A0A1U8A811_NELNU|nr:PREDICTED: uncharacterized protein LOC104601188 isoform X4 [Nelumbo nucifera]DAD28397.1 TPA_asm: hypothetical protein HUJ06_029865 [Nelumbo nucifera]